MNRFNELTMLDVGAGDERCAVASIHGPQARRVTTPNLDVHQHLWPEALLHALRSRDKPPRLRGWTLELAGEPPYEVDPRHHDPEARRIQAQEDGLDLALIAP